MDTDNIIAGGIIATIIVTIVSIALVTMSTDKKILKAIQAGADPMAASCAFRSDNPRTDCTIYLTKKEPDHANAH